MLIVVYSQAMIVLASNDSRSYDEVFNSWRVLLKDPTSVKKFKNIQEILERSW